jgi:O-antigen ligase
MILGLVLLQAVFTDRAAEIDTFSYGEGPISGTGSFNWRFANWRELLAIWSDEAPILGLGWGSTRFQVTPFGSIPHSVIVQLLVETGAVGLSFFAFIVLAFAKSVKRRHLHFPLEAACIAGIGVAVMVHGIAANWLNYVPAQYLAIITVGVICGATRLAPNSYNDEPPDAAPGQQPKLPQRHQSVSPKRHRRKI